MTKISFKASHRGQLVTFDWIGEFAADGYKAARLWSDASEFTDLQVCLVQPYVAPGICNVHRAPTFHACKSSHPGSCAGCTTDTTKHGKPV